LFDDETSRKPKSANLTNSARFLIACLSLIWVKTDKRERDQYGRIINGARIGKAYSPKSDLNQAQLMDLYFSGLDRTVMSQSKTAPHAFAVPDWRLMEAYLFPWISFNSPPEDYATPEPGTKPQPKKGATRHQIKHMAFRIWEYWTEKQQVLISHQANSGLVNEHFSDVRGWWEYSEDQPHPEKYAEWNGRIPSTRLS
jgi:hypothetical protein